MSALIKAHRRPVGTGTAVAGTYGVARSAATNYGKHKVNKKIAGLQEKVINLEKRLEEKSLIIIGGIGIFISVILGSFALTGFVVLTNPLNSFSFILPIFFVSTFLVYYGAKKHRKL